MCLYIYHIYRICSNRQETFLAIKLSLLVLILSSSFLACNSYNCVASYVDIIFHRGRFWAKSAASGSVRWWCFRSCWTVLSHVMRGRPSCLLQSAGGEANRMVMGDIKFAVCLFGTHLLWSYWLKFCAWAAVCPGYWPLASTWPHLRCDVGLEGEGNIEKKLCATVLCAITMVHKDTSSSYRSVDCIGIWSCLVWLCLPSASVSSVFVVLYTVYILKFFLLTSFSLPFSELILVGLALDLVD